MSRIEYHFSSKEGLTGLWTMNRTSTFENMVAWAQEGEGKAFTGARVFEVEVTDIFRDIATVR